MRPIFCFFNLLFFSFCVVFLSGCVYTEAPKGELKGELVVGIFDSSTNIVDVTQAFVSLSRIDIYSEKTGWVTILNKTVTHDVIGLNSFEFYGFVAKERLVPTTYTQINLTINDMKIFTKNTLLDSTLGAKSGLFNTTVVVESGVRSSLLFDFFVYDSLPQGEAQLIFPLVKILAQRNSQFSIKENIVIAQRAATTSSQTYRMYANQSVLV